MASSKESVRVGSRETLWMKDHLPAASLQPYLPGYEDAKLAKIRYNEVVSTTFTFTGPREKLNQLRAEMAEELVVTAMVNSMTPRPNDEGCWRLVMDLTDRLVFISWLRGKACLDSHLSQPAKV